MDGHFSPGDLVSLEENHNDGRLNEHLESQDDNNSWNQRPGEPKIMPTYAAKRMGLSVDLSLSLLCRLVLRFHEATRERGDRLGVHPGRRDRNDNERRRQQLPARLRPGVPRRDDLHVLVWTESSPWEAPQDLGVGCARSPTSAALK